MIGEDQIPARNMPEAKEHYDEVDGGSAVFYRCHHCVYQTSSLLEIEQHVRTHVAGLRPTRLRDAFGHVIKLR